MKKNLFKIFAFCLMAIILAFPIAVHADTTLGVNGKAAQNLYKISDDSIIMVDSTANTSEINTALSDAGKLATSSAKYMVYVPSGNYNIDSTIKVPANVVLVGESSSVFSATSLDKMLFINGSVYGGSFNGNGSTDMICWFDYVQFSNSNGEIRSAIIKGAKTDGVHYGSSVNKKALGGAKVIGNTISNCKNGVTAANASSTYALISGNKISNIGKGKEGSGINITHANVSTITNNTISSTKGHGISTETDLKGYVQNKITIKEISGNKISNTGVHGIWIDNKVTLKKVSGNTIASSKGCGIAIEKQGVINDLSKNTITKSKKSNITMNGKGSKLTVGSGNTITKSKSIGIMVSAKAQLTIKGKNNVIKNNKNDIRVEKKKGAKFTFKNKRKNKIPNIRIV